jgi:hypothetical protein
MTVRLSSLGGAPLHDTLPNFHNTPLRLTALAAAVAADSHARVGEAAALLERVDVTRAALPLCLTRARSVH